MRNSQKSIWLAALSASLALSLPSPSFADHNKHTAQGGLGANTQVSAVKANEIKIAHSGVTYADPCHSMLAYPSEYTACRRTLLKWENKTSAVKPPVEAKRSTSPKKTKTVKRSRKAKRASAPVVAKKHKKSFCHFCVPTLMLGVGY